MSEEREQIDYPATGVGEHVSASTAIRMGAQCSQKKTHRASRYPVCFEPLLGEASGPAAADGGVGAAHVVAGGLDLLAVAVGLFVDDLKVATQLGDELLAGHRTRATPEVTGSQHIAHD